MPAHYLSEPINLTGIRVRATAVFEPHRLLTSVDFDVFSLELAADRSA